MSEPGEDRRWIVAPPGPTEIALRLDVGADVELTDEQVLAVEQLLAALEAGEVEEPEVVGHTFYGDLFKQLPRTPPQTPPTGPSCTGVQCSGLSCTGLTMKLGAAGGGWSLGGTFGIGQ